MRILAIESSCDDTAAAVVQNGRKILSSVLTSQIEDHQKFGGVVPELASRRHSENMIPVIQHALQEAKCSLSDIDAVAVTYAPGLVGALLVGTSVAKGLALALNKPLIPVHHIAGHIAANYIAHPHLTPPYLSLIVSGGHTHIIEVLDYTRFSLIGRTRDDAAGECFDKVARVLGYPYPGGVHLDRAAADGNSSAYTLPIPRVEGSPFDYSFSGLKTAVINLVHRAEQRGEFETINKNDLAASFQHKIAHILIDRFICAADHLKYKTLTLAGGVSANSSVRELLTTRCLETDRQCFIPPINLCGDNAAMIGCQAFYNWEAGITADETLNAVPTLSIESINK